MNTVVRELPPGRLARARSYKVREADCGSGYIDFTFRGTQSISRVLGCSRRVLNNPIEDWCNVATELGWIFTHREMTELLHDDDLGAVDARRGAQRVRGRAGEIILPVSRNRGHRPVSI